MMSQYSRYLNDPLDKEYLIIPDSEVEEGSLPKEDIEISQALAALKHIHLESGNIGILSRLFKTREYLVWEDKFNAQKERTKTLIFSSKFHRAAYHRLVNSIPKDVYDFDKSFYDLFQRIENLRL